MDYILYNAEKKRVQIVHDTLPPELPIDEQLIGSFPNKLFPETSYTRFVVGTLMHQHGFASIAGLTIRDYAVDPEPTTDTPPAE